MAELSSPVPIVLVIDADMATSRLASLYLEAFPYEVRCYSVLDAVFPLADASRTMLVLLNASFPTGPEASLLQNLHSELPGVPFFGMEDPGFSKADSETESPRTDATFAGFLNKPLDADAFFKVLDYSERIGKEASIAIRSDPASPANPSVSHPLAGMMAFLEEMGMGDNLARQLAESFVERGPEYIGDLDAKLSQKDYEGMDAPAHAMKGMSGNLRFHDLTQLSERIRILLQRNDTSSLQELVDQLKAEYAKVETALREHWPGLP